MTDFEVLQYVTSKRHYPHVIDPSVLECAKNLNFKRNERMHRPEENSTFDAIRGEYE